MKVIEGIRFAKRYAPVPLTEWQLDILEGIFANRFSIIILPSGYGKTLLAAINVSARLFCEHTRIRSFGVAGDQEQAGLLDQAIEGICDHPAGTLLSIERELTNDGITERIHVIANKGEESHARIWEIENNDTD